MRAYAKLFAWQLALTPLAASAFFFDLLHPTSFSSSPIFYATLLAYSLLAIGSAVFLKTGRANDLSQEWRHELSLFSQFVATFVGLLSIAVFLAWGMASFEANRANLALRIGGRIAFAYFAISLLASPVMSALQGRFSNALILVRRVAGILCFLFVLKHGVDYYLMERLYYPGFYSENQPVFLGEFFDFLKYSASNLAYRFDALSWLVAGSLVFILWITSNRISYERLGKFWKSLHALAYPAFVLSILHVAMSGRFDGFYAFLLVAVAVSRFAVFSSASPVRASEDSSRWLCVVCGFVYDEKLGDPDSWIAPGTKFRDIPDDWRCPLCYVTKVDFVPIADTETASMAEASKASVSSIRPLTEDVIELVLKFDGALPKSLPGQFAKLRLKDFDGEFSRSYSIASCANDSWTFLIRLKKDGRAGRAFSKCSAGDVMGFEGPYGTFVLRDTPSPKVFLATGTGLAPVYRMANEAKVGTPMTLRFWLRNESEIFYEKELGAIKGLKTEIWLSREKIGDHFHGRISVSKSEFPSDAEFYVCGNPEMTEQAVANLAESGYGNVYFEKFT